MAICPTLTIVPKCAGYHFHPQPLAVIPGIETTGKEDVRPAVVITESELSVSERLIEHVLDGFSAVDDVYSPVFHDVLVLQGKKQATSTDRRSSKTFRPFVQTYVLQWDSEDDFLPPGPYFLLADRLHQAWRLYDDTLGAFVTSVLPDNVNDPACFSPIRTTSDDGLYSTVAVPSRLYHVPSKERPLAGLRVSLKDNIDLAGLRTTLMNKAYAELYGEADSTATYVQQLIDLGAVIVGKTKLCSFASAEEPTDQWIDFHCPFNPRGDGYQTPSGSTTGGAAALAGYPWLDLSIGTDTSGSIRSPTALNGLFSIRPTRGALPSRPKDGVVESCRLFDTLGILSRSIDGIRSVLQNSSGLINATSFPKRLLYPKDFFPQADPVQQGMVDLFIGKVEAFLGVEREEISITELWNASKPVEAGGKPLLGFLKMSAVWPMYWYTYHAFDDFRAEYKSKYGKPPYVGPYMETRWRIAHGFTEQQRDQGAAEMAVFRTWFSEHIMGPSPNSISNAVMIMPFGSADPKYRDQNNGLPDIVGSFSPFYLSPMLQVPQVMIPIGQKRYQSRVSMRTEYQPIVSSFVGAQGSDLMLLNLAKAALDFAGWPTEVKTGRFMYEVGDNERNTAPTEA